MTTSAVLIELLQRFINETQTSTGQIGIVQEYMENEPHYGYSALVAEWSYHYYEAEVSMAGRLLDRLKEQTE